MSNELDREPKVIVYHIDGKKDGDAVIDAVGTHHIPVQFERLNIKGKCIFLRGGRIGAVG
jgi:hypothetical protein